jgi:hypothetical protein
MGKTGYKNGSDLLIKIDGNAFGHCTSHTITYSAETKDRAVKPVATASSDSGLWSGKSVSGLSIAISAEGLRFWEESEGGFKKILPLWKAGRPVEVSAFERGSDAEPYLTGKFVITKLDETNPAKDDATYSVELENDGEPTLFDESKITEAPASEPVGG